MKAGAQEAAFRLQPTQVKPYSIYMYIYMCVYLHILFIYMCIDTYLETIRY